MSEPGWAKLPHFVSDALTRGDLTFAEHGILTFLIGAINHRTEEYVSTLRALADAMQWDPTPDYLSKLLRSLRDAGWLDFESRPGQRKAYVIRCGSRLVGGDLGPDLGDDLGHTSDSTRSPQSEVTPESPRSHSPPNPGDDSDPWDLGPPTSPRSQEQKEEVDKTVHLSLQRDVGPPTIEPCLECGLKFKGEELINGFCPRCASSGKYDTRGSH